MPGRVGPQQVFAGAGLLSHCAVSDRGCNAAGWPAAAYILVGRADLAAMAAVPQPAQQSASDAAPPAATLLEGFSAAADTPAGHRRQRRRSSKGGRRPAEAAPPPQRGHAALPPYQQRLLEPSELSLCTCMVHQVGSGLHDAAAVAAAWQQSTASDCHTAHTAVSSRARAAFDFAFASSFTYPTVPPPSSDAAPTQFAAGGDADGLEAAQASSERRPPSIGHGPAAQRFARDLRLMEVRAHPWSTSRCNIEPRPCDDGSGGVLWCL